MTIYNAYTKLTEIDVVCIFLSKKNAVNYVCQLRRYLMKFNHISLM